MDLSSPHTGPAGKHKRIKEKLTQVWLEVLQMGPISPEHSHADECRAAPSPGGETGHPSPLQTSDKEEMLGKNEETLIEARSRSKSLRCQGLGASQVQEERSGQGAPKGFAA